MSLDLDVHGGIIVKVAKNEWLDSKGSGYGPMTKFFEGCNGP